MAEKLKSISRQIHWSLLLRAAIFALSWFLFPFWLFFLVSLYLYFVPLFQANKLAVPFFILLILAFIEPPSWLFILIFGVLFYFLLLIKDLLLIDRKSAYELLVIALSFFLLRDFYERLGAGFGSASIWFAFLVAALIGILLGSFMKAFNAEERQTRRIAACLSFLIVWQFLIAGLFLPLDFVYQSVIIFLVVILAIDLIPEYFLSGGSRQKTFTTAATVFAALALVLASARWGI